MAMRKQFMEPSSSELNSPILIQWIMFTRVCFLYLSTICEDCCLFINKVLDRMGAKPLNIIVYGDEMTPGNPLRPDDGREAWQWSYLIVEFPNHVLHSHAGWMHINTLRTSVLKNITGGVPLLAKTIMHILFAGNHNFAAGFYIQRPDGGMRIIKVQFMGFLQTRRG